MLTGLLKSFMLLFSSELCAQRAYYEVDANDTNKVHFTLKGTGVVSAATDDSDAPISLSPMFVRHGDGLEVVLHREYDCSIIVS